jgi:GntR family transcriptional regulator/MocR family aminotransferase
MPRATIPLELGGEGALFLQIARALAADIRRGRLLPGARLPGTRSLALSMNVHRNTVLAAYEELAAEGWVTTRPAGGTFVASDLPDPTPRRLGTRRAGAVPASPGFAFEGATENEPGWVFPPGVCGLSTGSPDLATVPAAALARAYRRALGRGADTLAYGDAEGHPALRRSLAQLVRSQRGIAASEASVLVTRGSQMGLFLAARALIRPGDVVAIEEPGYTPAWRVFEEAGARLLPLRVDERGVVVSELAAALEREPVRAVYLTPHHQYPTTVTLSPGRRIELLALASRARVALIEDDYDHEFHYDGRPVLPLASADPAGVVIYLGTLSKTLAPGLRLGFVVAPERLVARLAELRFLVDRQGDHALECAVAELIDEGDLERHIRRARRVYQARRDLYAAALGRALGSAFSFSIPTGGLSLWLAADPDLDLEAWAGRCLDRGYGVVIGRHFTLGQRPIAAVRLSFARHEETVLAEAARALGAALPGGRKRPGSTGTRQELARPPRSG